MSTNDRRWAVAIVLSLVAAVSVIVAMSADDDEPEPRPVADVAPVQARYDVTGPGTVSLTFTNRTGGSEQDDVNVFQDPWGYQFPYTGDFLYVSVQNGNDYGEVTCTITVDGTLVSSASSDADYGIATCSF